MSHEILAPSFERRDKRGLFQEILNAGSWETLLRGTMSAGAVMGNHYHKRTSIFFHLTSGSVNIKTVNVESMETDEFVLPAGKGVLLKTHESHAINFLEESEFIMLKSHRYDPEDPDTYPFEVR